MLEIINVFSNAIHVYSNSGNCSNPGILGNADDPGKADNIAGNPSIVGNGGILDNPGNAGDGMVAITMLNVYCVSQRLQYSRVFCVVVFRILSVIFSFTRALSQSLAHAQQL